MLLSTFDDQDPNRVRRSIFLTAFVLFISATYQLEMHLPKTLVTSKDSAFTIGYSTVVPVLIGVLVYLLSRLWHAWRISLAMFVKDWNFDEYLVGGKPLQSKESPFADMVAEIREFREKMAELYSPAFEKDRSNFDDFAALTELSATKLRSMIELQSSLETNFVDEFARDAARDFARKFEIEMTREMRSKIETGLAQSLRNARENANRPPELQRLEDLVHEFEHDVKTIAGFRKDGNAIIKRHLKGVRLLGKDYPIDAIEHLGQIEPSKLEAAKNHRKREIDVFEFYIPATVAVAAAGYGILVWIGMV